MNIHQPRASSKQLKIDAIVKMGSDTRCHSQNKYTMPHACHSSLSIRCNGYCNINKQRDQKDIITKPFMI